MAYQHPSGKTLKVLVVDDSESARAHTRELLQDIDCTVQEAADGPAGMQLVSTNKPFDLIILDWHMPEMGGEDFCRLVREDPFLAVTKILMLTVEMERQAVISAVRAGANAYVAKPLSKDVLLDKLRHLQLIA